jgi:hypothetical protein
MNDYTLAGLEPFFEETSDVVGFKFRISFKKLGRNLKKLARSPELRAALKVGMKAVQNPAIGLALGIPPGTIQGIKAGVAALGIQKRAEEGDARARAVIERALAGGEPLSTASASTEAAPPIATCPACGTVL